MKQGMNNCAKGKTDDVDLAKKGRNFRRKEKSGLQTRRSLTDVT